MSKANDNILRFPTQKKALTQALKKKILKHIQMITARGRTLTADDIRIFGNELVLRHPAIHSLDIFIYLRKLFLIALIERYKIPISIQNTLENLTDQLRDFLNDLSPEEKKIRKEACEICLWAVNDAYVILGERRFTDKDARRNHRIADKKEKRFRRQRHH